LAITRRLFLAQGGLTTMALAMRRGMSHATPPQFRTQVNAGSLAQFVDPLPIPEIIQSSGHRPSPDNPAVQLPFYWVAMRQFETKVHRDLKPTR
jgi:spore coat protein A